MIEGMQNSSWMTQMDEILKLIGSEEAAKHFNVQFFSSSNFRLFMLSHGYECVTVIKGLRYDISYTIVILVYVIKCTRA